MALADILNRIEADSTSEAQVLTEAARAEADRLLADARGKAEEAAEAIARDAARESGLQAATVLANARLAARDSLLSEKREVLDGALALLAERIVALPDAAYTAFLARAIVDAARGDERVLVAAADAGRLKGLAAAVASTAEAAGRRFELVYDDAPAAAEHGVVLLGERDSVDLSIAGIIDGQREELLMRLAARIFTPEEASA